MNGANNSITELFEWDPTEKVATRPMFMQYRVPGQTYALFYTHDGNKNVSEVVHYSRANGVAAHYEYAPFGETTTQVRQGGVATYDFAALNPWRFSSEYSDDASATVYYNYRHYEPVLGRWMQRDPIGGRLESKLYSYCGNRVYRYDRLGLFTFEDFKGRVPDSENNNSRGARVFWKYGLLYAIENYIMTFFDGDCKKAIKDAGAGPCPCTECYKVESSFSDISITFVFVPSKSWVKEIAKNDEDLLAHENLHITIGEKEVVKEVARIKGLNIAATSKLYCNLDKAKYEAESEIKDKLNKEYETSKKELNGCKTSMITIQIMEIFLISKNSGRISMPNRVQCVVVALLITFWGVGCSTNEVAHSQLSVFAPVSFSTKGVDFDVEVRNNGVPNDNEIVGTVFSKSGIRSVWLHAQLSHSDPIPAEGPRKNISLSKSYGGAASPSAPISEVSSVVKIPEELMNRRYIDLDVEAFLESDENFRCSVRLFNMSSSMCRDKSLRDSRVRAH